MKHFLLIDDHEIVRAGVKTVMGGLYKPCTITEADNGETVLSELKKQHFDLIIMDVQIPGTDTNWLLDHIITEYPKSKVLMFSMSPEKIYARKFLKAGAMGFVSKNSGLAELQRAIDMVLNNKQYISEELAAIIGE